MYISFEEFDETLIVELSGELDHHSAVEVRNKMDDRLERDNFINLILNFKGVTFMDSSGIGVVIGRFKKLQRKKGRVIITNINENVRRVFDLSGMFKIIGLYKDVNEALRNL